MTVKSNNGNGKNLAFKSAPKLVLNDQDRLYLATAVKSVNKLTFVYTLACHKCNATQWEIMPKTEIATFDNVRDADIYYRTVRQVMDFQQKMPGPKCIMESMADTIKKFMENTR